MKILHVTDGSIFNFDGVSTYINELIESASNDGTESLVLTTVPFNPDRLRIVNHKARVIEYRKITFLSADKFNFSLPAGIKRDIKDFNPDIIWIHTIGPLGFGAALSGRKKYRILYTKHCFDGDLWCMHLRVPRQFQWMYYMVASFAENTILKFSTVAILHTNQLEKLKSGRYFTRFRYVNPAISGKFFEKMDGQVKKWAGKITLGFCGRLDPEKGIEKLFIASEICRKEYNITNLHLLLVGDGAEGHRLVGKYPHTETTITGFVDDVIHYLDIMDVFVLPSETETTSISSLEAYTRGLKVFSTPVGFVGQNANKFPNVYNFRTAGELAMLVKEKAGRSNPSRDALSDLFMDSVITFRSLYEMVKSGAL